VRNQELLLTIEWIAAEQKDTEAKRISRASRHQEPASVIPGYFAKTSKQI